jgi:hypothetical protein
MEDFKYLGTTLTNQNSIQEEIKGRLESENACCQSVQCLLSVGAMLAVSRCNACCHSLHYRLRSRLLPKNLQIKIYRNIILLVVLYGCETWSLTLREERRLRVSIRC